MASCGDSRASQSSKNVRGGFVPFHPSGQMAASPRINADISQIRRKPQAESSRHLEASQLQGSGIQRMTRAGSLQIGSAKGHQSTYPVPPRSARVERSGSPPAGVNHNAMPRPPSRGPSSAGTPSKQASSVSITPRPAHMQLPKASLVASPQSSGTFPMTPDTSRPTVLCATPQGFSAGPAHSSSLTLAQPRLSPVMANTLASSATLVKRSKSDGTVLR